MRKLSRLGLTCGLAVMLASLAMVLGQGFGGGGFGIGGLLKNKSVQKEIKLTDEQVAKVDDVVKQVQAKHNEEFKAAQKIEDQQERREKFGELQKIQSQDILKDLGDVLKPDQLKRFKQIELQVQGTRAFQDPEVQKELNLTDDQKDKIKTISEDAGKEMQEARKSSQGNFEEAGKKFRVIQKDAREKAVAVLTPEQKKTWKEMTGEPFEVKFEPGQFGKGKGGKRKRDQ
jgi:Spy/CpxP family protein refolding chaperone